MSITKKTQRKLAQKEALKDKGLQLSKKIVSSMLAVGFAMSGIVPSLQNVRIAKAAEGDNGIVRVNSTDNLMKDNVANIYAEEISASGNVGLNRFKYFDVKNEQVANLFFQKEGGTQNVNTLVNMVQEKINIAGTVNAVRNNQVGGHLFFLSPKGMVVSASGVVNAGALTVMTPPEEFFKNAGYGVKTITTNENGTDTVTKEFVTTDIWAADATKVQNYLALQGPYLAKGKMAGFDENNDLVEASIPINGSGTIAVHGTMNAATAITLSAANIEVGKTAGDKALLQTGVVFENTVNAGGKFTGATVKSGEKLTATADDKGNIILVDPSNPSASDYISKTTTTEVSTVTTTTEKINTKVTKNSEAPTTKDETKTKTVTEIISTSVAEFVAAKETDKTTEAVFSKETDKEYTKPADTEDTKYELSNDKKTLTTTVTKTETQGSDTTTTVTKTESTEKSKTSEAGKDTDTAGTKSSPKVEEKYADVTNGNVLTGDGGIHLLATTDEVNFKNDGSSGFVKFQSWFGSVSDPSKASIKATLKELLSETDFAALSETLLKTPDDATSLQTVWKQFVGRANDTKKATVTVGEGATIAAVGNADISSSAILNQTLGEDDYNNLSKQFAQTQAVTVVNGKVSGADVNISATAESAYKSEGSAGLGSLLTANKKISNLAKLLPDALKSSKAGTLAEKGIDLANEVNVALGIVNSKAEVTVGEKADLKAEMLKVKDAKGEMKPFEYEKTDEEGNKTKENVGGNVNISSTATTTTDIQFAIQPKVKEDEQTEGSGNDFLNGAIIWEQTSADAIVDLSGKSTINAMEGGITIGANATNSATAAASIEGVEEGKKKVPSYFNAAVGIVNQNNNAKVAISESNADPSISGGVLAITAITTNFTDSTIGVKADGNEAFSTAVNIVNTDTKATVENKAKLAGGAVVVSANDIVAGFDIKTSNAYGPEEESTFNKMKDKLMSVKFVKSAADKIKQITGAAQENSDGASGDGASTPPDTTENADSWNKYFDVGAAVAVVNASNTAKVDLKEGSALTGIAGVDVSSGVTLADKNIHTTSILASQMTGKKAGVSAAVAVEKMVNKADTIVGDNVKLVTLTGDVSATATVNDRYNRLDIMNAALKASWDIVKEKWSHLGDDIKGAAKTQWEKLTESIKALTEFKKPADSEKAAEAARKAEEALEELKKTGAGMALGLVATGEALKTYTDAANWATMYTAASTRATKDETGSLGMATGTVGIQNITDKANVNIGSDAVLMSQLVDESGKPVPGAPQGTIKTAAETNSGNVLVSGKWGLIPNTSSTSGGDFGIGGTVGIQNVTSKSEVIVNKGATLRGGEVDVNADNNVMNVGLAVGGSAAGTLGVSGMTSYMGGTSAGIVRVDDDAILSASRVFGEVEKEDKTKAPGDLATGKINITANNQTVLTGVAGEVTRANAAAIGASVGIIDYDVHSKALVGNIERNDTAGAATWNANSVDVTAANSGVVNTLTVAGVSAGGQKSKAGQERSGSDINFRNISEGNDSTQNPENSGTPSLTADGGARRSLNDISVNSNGIGGNKESDAPATNPASDPVDDVVIDPKKPNETTVNRSNDGDNGNGAENENTSDQNTQSSSKVNIAIAGSVSWNNIDERTEAKLSQVTVNMTDTVKAADYTGTKQPVENKTVNVSATDNTFIGAYSGAMALTKAGNDAGSNAGGQEGGKFSGTLSGAVAVNNIYKNSSAEIDRATVQKELGINNKAENKGTQVAAGVAVGAERGDRSNSYGFNIDASGSFNFINSNVKALVKNSNIAGNSVAPVNLNNTAYNKDVQVAGGLSVNYTKSSVGIGAAIAVNKIKNDITADISGSTLGANGAGLGAIKNLAVSKIYQVGGAISLGIVPGSEKRNYVTANAAVAVNNLTNKLNATGSNNTIYAKTLAVEARDGNLTETETANEYIKQLYDEGFDIDENAGNIGAVKNASENKDIDVDTKTNGELNTNQETIKEKNDKGQLEDRNKETVKYNQKKVDVVNGGNIIVGSAMDLTVNLSKTSAANLGAAVVYNKIDNDFKAKLSGGSVNITAAEPTDAPSVKVAAKSETLQVGVSAGVSVKNGDPTKPFKGASAAGSVTIQRADNDTTATLENINIKSDRTEVTAENKSTQTTVAGLATVAGANASMGMSWAQNNLNNTTGAYVNGITLDKFSTDTAKTANLKVDSLNSSKTLAVGAGVNVTFNIGGKGFSVGANGAYAANKGINSTEAVIDKYVNGSTQRRNTINNAGIISATATDESNLKGIAGNIVVDVTAGKSVVGASVGGAVVNNDIGTADKKQKIRAEINETDITTAAEGTVTANAVNEASILAVGAGGAVTAGAGTVQVSAMGSVATSAIHTDTVAGMTNTNIDKNDTNKKNATVTVTADSKNKIISTADGLSVSAGTGLANVAASAAVSKVTSNADTKAIISGGTQNVKSELVKAVSDSKITDVAAAISAGVGIGLAGAAGSANVAINNIGNDVTAKIEKGAVINAYDTLGVLAESSDTLRNYGGAVSVGVGAKAGVALGATVVVNKITGNTEASIDGSTVSAKGNSGTVSVKEYEPDGEYDIIKNTGDTTDNVLIGIKTKETTVDKKGVVVNADAKHTLNDISVTAGVGASFLAGVGVNATVVTNTINGNTKAVINNSDVNKNLTNNSDVSVQANDRMDVSSHVGTLSVGAAGLVGIGAAASVDVNNFSRTTDAGITGKAGKNTVNADNAKVKAFGSTNFLLSESGLSIGAGKVGIGATGVVSKNTFTNNTNATMSNINGQINRLDIDAESVKQLRAYTNAASVAGGLVAVAATASVINTTDTSETKAELADSTLTKDKSKTDSKVNVEANNHAVLGSQTSGGAIAIGLGGAAGVTVANNNIKNTVVADVKNSNIGKEDNAYKTFTAKSNNKFTDKFLNVSVAGGLVAVGVGVANNTINSSALTNITGGKVYADKIDIIANENRTIKETMVAAAVGFATVNTNVTINTIGGAMLDTYTDTTAKDESKSYDSKAIQKLSLDADNEAKELNNQLSTMKQTKDMFTYDKTTLAYDKGTKTKGVQTVLDGAVLKSSGNVDINSTATTNTNVVVGQGAASISLGSVNVAVVNTTVGTDSGITVKGGNIQGRNVNIISQSDGLLKQNTVQVGASMGLAVGVAVSKLTREGNNIITIGDNSRDTVIRAGLDGKTIVAGEAQVIPTLTINATDNTIVENTATSASVAAAGATAQVIKALDYSDTKVDIKGKADLSAYDYAIKNENKIFKWEQFRAGTLKDANGNVLYDIVRSTDGSKQIAVIKDGAGNTVRTMEYIGNSITYNDMVNNVQYNIEYTSSGFLGLREKIIVRDSGGNEIGRIETDGFGNITTSSNVGIVDAAYNAVTSFWDLAYTETGNELGKVDIKAVNNNRVSAELSGGGAGGISGSGIVVLAEQGKREKDGKVKGTTAVNVAGANSFTGEDVSLSAQNKATAYAKEFGFGLSLLSASVFKTTANLQGAVNTDIKNGQTFTANNLKLSAEAIQPTDNGKYSAEAHTQAISTGGGNVAVNHAYAKTGIDTKLSVGSASYTAVNKKEVQRKDIYNAAGNQITGREITLAGGWEAVEGGTALDLKAQSTVSTKSNVTGINGSIISVGSNNAYTENKNNVTLNFNPGTYKAGYLNLTAGVTDNVFTTANGDGGSVVSVSPYAARTVHTNASSTVINLSGNYELTGDMKVNATTGVVQDMLSSAVQATIVGGSGTIGESDINNKAKVNLANGTSIKTDGTVNIGALNTVDFNLNREYAVKGNGFGAGTMAVAKMNNVVKTDSQVDLANAQIVSKGAQTYNAKTDNNIKSQVYVLSAGVIAGAHGENTLNINATDKVTQSVGGLLSVSGKEADIAIGAVDNQILNTRAMVDNVGGAVAGSSAITNNTLLRTNTVDIGGKIFSRHDTKLYAGQGADGKMGQMKLTSSAEAMTMGLIPVALPPQINNIFIQDNRVNVKSSGDVQAIRNVYLYADAGKETTDLFSGRYTMYAGKGESKYAATTNGISNVEGRDGIKGKTAINIITVSGSVLAGAGNRQTFKIGKMDATNPEMLVVTAKDQYDVIMDYYKAHPGLAKQNVVLVLSDADYNKQIGGLSGYNVKKLSEIIEMNDIAKNYSGVTAADFKLSSEDYAVKRLERLSELTKLMAANEKDDKTAYVGYKADYDRIFEQLRKEGVVGEDGKILRQVVVNSIELPDLAASGGNVIAQSLAFGGGGSVRAKGNPVLTVENNTTLATKINNITVYEPGGEIYYNSVLLDTNSVPKKLNGASVKTMQADKGYTSEINILGNNNISEINYRLNDLQEVQTDSEKDLKMPVKADIIIQGQVVAESGKITVRSQNDSIALEGKSAQDVAAVVGKEVSMSAMGSISQNYKDDIENIGGDPKDQYKAAYDNYMKNEFPKIAITKDEFTVYFQKDDVSITTSSKSRLSGDDIFINAADVNINGTIQSGYDKYYVELSNDTLLDAKNHVVKAGTAEAAGAITLEQRIRQITEANGKTVVSDESVIGNPLYQVVSGSEVKNANGYYDYMINVYYNPSGNDGKGKLLTQNVDSKGGRVYVTGRISSTGSGEIYCLDGTYNIDVKNTSKYVLQTGKLAVNDVEGKVKITDTNQNTITTITRNDDGTLNAKLEKIFKDEDYKGRGVLDIGHGTYRSWETTKDGAVIWNIDTDSTGTDKYNLAYKPQENLRYNWTEGYYQSTTNTYRKKWYNARWGKGDAHDVTQTLINAEKEVTPIGTPVKTKSPKENGAYIGEVKSVNTGNIIGSQFSVGYTYNKTSEAVKVIRTDEWNQGFYGVHKYTEVTWEHQIGSANSFVIGVKADNPVGIKFIGDHTATSTVNVSSDAGLIVGGDIGNRQLYKFSDNSYDDKGIVDLRSEAGAISQIGGNIYGSGVKLAAKDSIENISISAGDEVLLMSEKLGAADGNPRKISVFVNSNMNAKGDVRVDDTFGSPDTDSVLIKTVGNRGNIRTMSDYNGMIEGKRIDLVSERGSIDALVKAGQNFVGTDTLSASLNATAAKNITLTQKSGDMRIGRIYSTDGNVTLNSPNSFVDALPYAENSAGTEDAQVEKWLKAGLISDSTAEQKLRDDSKAMVDEKNTALNKQSFIDSYKAEVNASYNRYATLKSKTDRTAAEEQEFNELKQFFTDVKYTRYLSLKNLVDRELTDDEQKEFAKEREEFEALKNIYAGYTGDGVYENAAEYLAKNEDAQKIQKAAEDAAKDAKKTEAFVDNYKEGVGKSYDRYAELKSKSGRTAEEEQELKGWQEVFGSYTSAADYLAKNANAQKLQSSDTNKYQMWDKTALLYSIQQSIINQTANSLPQTSTKDPNVKGNNITLNAGNSAGLLSDTVIKMHVDNLGDSKVTDDLTGKSGLENLKLLARTDASNVVWDSAADNGRGVITITEKLPIGIQTNTAAGKLTVGKYEGTTLKNLPGNAFIEGRVIKDATVEGNKDITINAIRANGHVSISSLGSIINGAAKDTAAIIGKDLNITAVGSVGSINNYITTNLTDGFLRAVGYAGKDPAAGGVYINNIGSGALKLVAVSTGGELRLEAEGDILMEEESTSDIKGVIQTENDGDIELISRKGNIGSAGKLLLVKNSDSATRKVTVGAGSGKNIYLEGVSTANDQRTAGGQLNLLIKEQSGNTLDNIKLNVNGALNLLNAQSDGAVEAKTSIEINTADTMNLKNAVIRTTDPAGTITLNAGEVTTVHKNTSRNPKASLLQENGALETKTLSATSTADLKLESAANKLTDVTLDNRSDATANNTVSLGNAGTHGLNVVVKNTLPDQNDTIHGTLSITKHELAAGESKVGDDITITGAKVTGGITVVNKVDNINNNGDLIVNSGDITLNAKGNISNTGAIAVNRNGNIKLTADKEIINEGNTGIGGNGNVSMNAKTDITNKGAVNIGGTGNIDLTAGNKIDKEGSFTVNNGDITMNATADISNKGEITVKQNGNVSLTSANDKITNEGNTGIGGNGNVSMNAKTDITNKGAVNIGGTGNINLTAGNKIDKDGSFTVNNGDITMNATADISNKGEITVKQNGNVSLTSANDKIINEGNTGIGGNGNVSMNAKTDIINKGAVNIGGTGNIDLTAGNKIDKEGSFTVNNGDITMNATADISNKGEITVKQNGNVSLTSANDKITNDDDINIGGNGDIIFEAKKDISNKGDIAVKQNGNIKIISGSEINNDLGKIDIGGDGDITMTADKKITNDGDINVAGNGNIKMTAGSEIVNDGNMKIIVNNGDITMNAKTNISNDGYITVKQNGNVNMTAGNNIANDIDINIGGNGDIIMNAKTDITNIGDISVNRNGNVNITAGNEIGNDGNIKIGGNGDTNMNADKNIINSGNIDINGNGNINMTAGEDVFNGDFDAANYGKMEISGKGNIDLTAKKGSVYNYKGADILTMDGKVSLKSDSDKYALYYYDEDNSYARVDISEDKYHTLVIDNDGYAEFDGKKRRIFVDGSIFNAGDIVALGDTATIELIAKSGDIINYDNFNVLDDGSEEMRGTAISTGNVVMSAREGLVYNYHNLVSEKKVSLTAKEGLGSFGTSIHAGEGIELTDTDGDLINRANLVSMEGDVSVSAENGAVINMLDGDILALGGSVKLYAGGQVTDAVEGGNRPIYTVNTAGEVNKFDIDLDKNPDFSDKTIVVMDKYYIKDGNPVLIDDTIDTSTLTTEQKDSMYGLISYVEYERPAGGGRSIEKRIPILDASGDQLRAKGDAEVYRTGDLVNRGDISALGKTIEQPDGSLKPDPENRGEVSLTSAYSNVSNYDNFGTIDGKEVYEIETSKIFNKTSKFYEDKKYVVSNGDMAFKAKGYIYNTLTNIGEGNVSYDAGGDVNIGSYLSGTHSGGVLAVRSSEGKIYGAGDLSADKGIVLDAAKGVDIDDSKIISDGGVVRISATEGGIKFGSAGSEIRSAGSIDIGAESGDVDVRDAELEAKELMAIGTKDGNVKIDDLTGKEVVLYSTGEDKHIEANKINVADNLVLRGDNINLRKVNHTKEGWLHVDAVGADGSAIKGAIDAEINGDTHFSTLNAAKANINITDGGKLAMDKLHIVDRGQFNAMDYLTTVHGTPVSNEDSKAVYFDTGDGKGNALSRELNLEKVLFGAYGTDFDEGDVAASYKKPEYIIDLREILASQGTVISSYSKGNDGWMNLYIDKPDFQRSNGVLLTIKGNYYANHQRYAADDLSTMVADTKAVNIFNGYYKDSIGLFDRFNLIDGTAHNYSDFVAIGKLQDGSLIVIPSDTQESDDEKEKKL